MTCIIFPGLLFFPSGLCRWKLLCTEGGVFSRKKKIESDFLTQVLSQTPRASFEAGDSWLHYQTMMPPPTPPAGSEGGQVTSRQHPADWKHLELLLWGTHWLQSMPCGQIPRACRNERCPCVCLRECWFQTSLEERSSPYRVRLLCLRRTCFSPFSFHSSANQISRVISTGVFSPWHTPPVKVWMHLTKSYE